jgi:hypothetical protein
MPRDEVLAGDTRAWLEQAAKDLRRVEILLAVTPPDVEGALFHSQQAAEKALKGFLTWHDIAFRQVHELGEIGRQCLQADPTLSDRQFLDEVCGPIPLSWRAVRASSRRSSRCSRPLAGSARSDHVSTTRKSETARGRLILAPRHTSRSVGH